MSFSMIFVAGHKDKTQPAMIALVVGAGAVWSVFIGGTLALWLVSLIGIAVGTTLLRKIPKHWMHRIAVTLFAGFGLLALIQAALEALKSVSPT